MPADVKAAISAARVALSEVAVLKAVTELLCGSIAVVTRVHACRKARSLSQRGSARDSG